MSIPKNKYRCAGCQKITHITNQKMISWFKTPKHHSHNQEAMAFCKKCANRQAPNETGRALSKRLDPALAKPKNYVARW